MKKIISIIMIILMTFTYLLPVKAFDQNITVNVSKSYGKYNELDYFQFKSVKKPNNTIVAAICTKYHLQVPSAGVTCNLTDTWPKEIQAGVAKIIELAQQSGLNNNDMNKPYYYAELAINLFLYDKNGHDANNLISTTRGPADILGDYYYYYTSAEKEYNRVKKEISLSLTRTGKWNYYFDSNDTTNQIENTYKINGESSNKYQVSIESHIINTDNNNSRDIPNINNFTISITDTNGNSLNNPVLNGGQSFKIKVTGITNLILEPNEKLEIKIKVKGTKSYSKAANYSCGSSVQPFTINDVEPKSENKELLSYITIRKTEEPDYPSLQIIKNDGNNQILPGVTIEIQKDGKIFDILHTEDGNLQIDDLEAGSYSIQEKEAPDGYNIDSNKYYFDVTVNGTDVSLDYSPRQNQNSTGFEFDNSTNTLKFYLQNIQNLVKISKVDENGNLLDGAELEIVDEDGQRVSLDNNPLTWNTSNENPKKVRGLPAGIYYVREVSAPNGYKKLGTPVRFEVPNYTKLDELEDEVNVTVKVSVPNKKTTINVRKIDTSNKNNIKNAVFQIIDPDSNNPVKFSQSESILEVDESGIIDRWTSTTSDQTIKGLSTNKEYILREISAPTGYKKLGSDIRFKINSTGRVIMLEGATSSEATISVENDKTSFRVSKKDVVTDERIKGAQLQIKDSTGKVVLIVVTNDNKITPNDNGLDYWETKDDADFTIEGLPAGIYRIHEKKAPDGYIQNKEDIVFEVKEDGTIEVQGKEDANSLVVVTNKKNELYISKKDITGQDELEGATLVITNLDTNKEVANWVSGKTPKHIEALKPGNYELKEIQAPNGYVLSTETIKFTVSENGKILFNEEEKDSATLIMTNDTTKVYISKQDITTKEELPGAHLIVKDSEGNVVKNGEWDSTTEPHLIEGLGEGTYTLTEITAPEGYTKSEETITFTIDANGALSGNTIMYNTPMPEVPNTLSTQSIIITLAGLIIISGGIGLYFYGLRKKKDQI